MAGEEQGSRGLHQGGTRNQAGFWRSERGWFEGFKQPGEWPFRACGDCPKMGLSLQWPTAVKWPFHCSEMSISLQWPTGVKRPFHCSGHCSEIGHFPNVNGPLHCSEVLISLQWPTGVKRPFHCSGPLQWHCSGHCSEMALSTAVK